MQAAAATEHPELSLLEIDRRMEISPREFSRAYLHPRRPVVLAKATERWSANSLWGPNFFRERFGQKQVILGRKQKRYKTTMAEFIDYAWNFCELYREGDETEPFYLRNMSVAKHFPELLDDFCVSPLFLPNWLERWPLHHFFPVPQKSSAELFIGPPKAKVPALHRDRLMTHSWLSQVYGKKRFWMISPEQNDLVYQSEENPDYSLVNSVCKPDLEKYPLFKRTRVFTALLQQGETIFIPAGWWHVAECLTLAVSISGNFVNATNFENFRKLAVLPAFRRKLWFSRAVGRDLLWLHGVAYYAIDFFRSNGV